MKNKGLSGVQSLFVSFVVLAFCEVFFLMDVLADAFYLDLAFLSIDHNVLELITTFTLGLALIAIGWQIRRLLREHRIVQASVQVASGELQAVISARFSTWKLSPSEREIALLLIKGLSTQEIADLRETRIGTVKSQGSAIYQKAGVKGRNELVAYFVEDLLAGDKLIPGR